MFQVALGKEKPDELGYSSVTAMVAHHKVLKLFQNTQTTLREGDRGKNPEKVNDSTCSLKKYFSEIEVFTTLRDPLPVWQKTTLFPFFSFSEPFP